jgi:hypothetical protein
MVAEMELGFIRDRQRAGIEVGKAKGIYKGRPATFDRAGIVALRKEGMGATEIAKAIGCKRGTSTRRSRLRGCPKANWNLRWIVTLPLWSAQAPPRQIRVDISLTKWPPHPSP